MFIVLTLAALTVPTLRPAGDRDCDDECAVLVAALEWAITQVPTESRSRTFFDVGRRRNPPTGEQTPEVRTQTRYLAEAAAKLGVPAVRREEDERYLRCVEPPKFAACRRGTAWITVHTPRLESQDEAVARVVTGIENDPGQRVPFGENVKEARLRRIDGTWHVVESRIILFVN